MDWKKYGEKLEANGFYKFWQKHQKFIHAVEGIVVILLLIMVWTYMYKDYQIKEEINTNCGWGEEDYFCFCEKSEAQLYKNKFEYYINLSDGELLEHPDGIYNEGWEVSNVSLDR